MEALKGIDIAVKAFEKLPDKILYVAGTGPMMDEMQAYVSTHNMKNVRFFRLPAERGDDREIL